MQLFCPTLSTQSILLRDFLLPHNFYVAGFDQHLAFANIIAGQQSSFYIPGLFRTVAVTSFGLKIFLNVASVGSRARRKRKKFTAIVAVAFFLFSISLLKSHRILKGCFVYALPISISTVAAHFFRLYI